MEPITGTLKKKTKDGIIHERYFYVTGSALLQKHSKSHPDSDSKEVCKFRAIDFIEIIDNLNIKITLTDEYQDEVIILTAKSGEEASNWKNCLQNLMSQNGKAIIEKSGFLLKKSSNKLVTKLQERYFRLNESEICYYKKKNDKLTEHVGKILVASIQFVRAYDHSSACKTFEISDGNRIYLFQAADHEEMLSWTSTIDMVRSKVIEAQRVAQKEKEREETPYHIRVFDEEGKNQYIKLIDSEIDEIYPADYNILDNMLLSEHIECANKLIEYMYESFSDFKSARNNKPRYEIQALLMEEINVALSTKLFGPLQKESMQLLSASTGEVYKVIVFLTKHQRGLQKIFLPAQYVSSGCRYFGIYDSLPIICERYLSGNDGKKDGALSHLFDHIIRVWENFLVNPSEMIDKHSDGYFYTNCPTTMWESLNIHLKLATETQCTVLHLMVANKIVHALNSVVHKIHRYVDLIQTDNPLISDMPLEFFSALANDNAAHIEEIVQVIDKFDMDDVRDRINEMYDSVTMNLVECGQTCLKRLVKILMLEVQGEFDKLMSEEWYEDDNGPVPVAISTISDYLKDFQEFLMPFWLKKFKYYLLENVVICYTKSLLKERKSKVAQQNFTTVTNITSSSTANKAVANVSSFLSRMKDKMNAVYDKAKKALEDLDESSNNNDNKEIKVIPELTQLETINIESLGRIARDVNALNQFFTDHAGPEDTELFLSLIGEIQQLLVLPIEQIIKHALSRMTSLPSSAAAIHYVTMRCIKMRDDLDKDEVEEYIHLLKPALAQANLLAQQYELDGISESQLGLLYLDIDVTVDIEKMTQGSDLSYGNKVSRVMRNLANIPLNSITAKLENLKFSSSKTKNFFNEDDDENSVVDDNDVNNNVDDDDDDDIDYKHFDIETNKLIDNVMQNQLEIDEKSLLEAQEMEELLNRESIDRRNMVLTIESHLDKKSPKGPWQKRYFKLSTKQLIDPETNKMTYNYSLMWFKKRGGVMLKAIPIANIKSMLVVKSSRPLVYSIERRMLILDFDKYPDEQVLTVVQWKLLHNEQDEDESQHFLLSANKEAISNFYKQTIKTGFGLVNHDKVGDEDNFDTDSQSKFHFNINMVDGKEFVLRATKVDKLIKWINILATACGMAYDDNSHMWTKEGKIVAAELFEKKHNYRLSTKIYDDGDGIDFNKIREYDELQHKEEQKTHTPHITLKRGMIKSSESAEKNDYYKDSEVDNNAEGNQSNDHDDDDEQFVPNETEEEDDDELPPPPLYGSPPQTINRSSSIGSGSSGKRLSSKDNTIYQSTPPPMNACTNILSIFSGGKKK